MFSLHLNCKNLITLIGIHVHVIVNESELNRVFVHPITLLWLVWMCTYICLVLGCVTHDAVWCLNFQLQNKTKVAIIISLLTVVWAVW